MEEHFKVPAQADSLDQLLASLEEERNHLLVDELTGLTSRAKSEAYIRYQLECSAPVSIILTDLDGFKDVNARCGHAAGDAILAAVAQSLRADFEPFTAARWAGDQFLLLAPSVVPGLDEKASVVHRTLSRQYSVLVDSTSYTLDLAVSAGFAQTQPDDCIEHLIARAEDSLWRFREQNRR